MQPTATQPNSHTSRKKTQLTHVGDYPAHVPTGVGSPGVDSPGVLLCIYQEELSHSTIVLLTTILLSL